MSLVSFTKVVPGGVSRERNGGEEGEPIRKDRKPSDAWEAYTLYWDQSGNKVKATVTGFGSQTTIKFERERDSCGVKINNVNIFPDEPSFPHQSQLVPGVMIEPSNLRVLQFTKGTKYELEITPYQKLPVIIKMNVGG